MKTKGKLFWYIPELMLASCYTTATCCLHACTCTVGTNCMSELVVSRSEFTDRVVLVGSTFQQCAG